MFIIYQYIVVYLFYLILVLPVSLFSQDVNPEKTDITIRKALAAPWLEPDFESDREVIQWSDFRSKIKAALPNYTQEELTLELSRLDLKDQYVGGDINIGASASYDFSTKEAMQSKDSVTTHNLKINPSISKKFLRTGTTLSVNLNNTLSQTVVAGKDPTGSTMINSNFTLKQDLLKNFFGLLARQNIANSERNLAIDKLKRQNNERKLQKDYDLMYLDWILLWRKQEVLQKQLDRSTKSLANAREQRRLNYIDNGTYQQYYNTHLVYRQSLQDNEQNLFAMEQAFARFLGNKLYIPDKDILEPLLEKSMQKFEPLYFEDSWTWYINEQSLKQSQILFKFSKLQRLPELTLSTSLGVKAQVNHGNNSQGDYSLKPELTYSVDIKLSWPALMIKARNTIARSRINLQKLETSIEQQRQNFEIKVAKQYASHSYLLQTYEIRKEKYKAQAAINTSNQIKYRQARSSIRDLMDGEISKLNAELSLLNTENQLIEQLLNYQYETRNGDILNL